MAYKQYSIRDTTLGGGDWRRFEAEGMVRIGRLDAATLSRLRDGLDDIMLGRADVPYDRLLMQLDSSSGNYADLGRQTKGFKGATLNYRKIQDLELARVFRNYLETPVFHAICRRVYGEVPIACFRAMAMIKPAGAGTRLPWHQDRWRALDRDPLVTIWTSLDDANAKSGGLEVIPGSHRRGVLNPSHPSASSTTGSKPSATATPVAHGSTSRPGRSGCSTTGCCIARG